MFKKLKWIAIPIVLVIGSLAVSSYQLPPPEKWDPFVCRAYCNGQNNEWPSCKTPNANGACDQVVWCAEYWPC
jgi:hypothetical protein